MPSDDRDKEDFDPERLAQLAETQWPDKPWLPAALRNLKKGVWKSEGYLYFVSPARPNKTGSEWQFSENVWLEDSKEDYILDILVGQQIGGIEFLSVITSGSVMPRSGVWRKD